MLHFTHIALSMLYLTHIALHHVLHESIFTFFTHCMLVACMLQGDVSSRYLQIT